MREKDGCNHDKDTIDFGQSRTISMTTAKKFLSLTDSRTQSANVQKQVCTEVERCEHAQEQAKSHFMSLRRKLEDGGGTGPSPYEGLESDIAQFNAQSGELPSKLNQIDFSEEELVDLYERSAKLERAIEDFEEEKLNEELDLFTRMRNVPKIDNIPKEAQQLGSVKEVTNRVQTRTKEELRERHGISEEELEERVDSPDQAETENQSESQSEEEKQTEERRQSRR